MALRSKTWVVVGLTWLAAASAYAQGPTTIYAPVGGSFVPFRGGFGGTTSYRYGTSAPGTPSLRPMGGSASGRLSTRLDGMNDAMRPGLGASRSFLEPLTPLRDMGPGMTSRPSTLGGSMGSGMGSAGATRRGGRPPVGSYPFRVPPLLMGPSAPVMGM